MIKNEDDDTEALSSFYFDWIYECGQSFMQLKQKDKKKIQKKIQKKLYNFFCREAVFLCLELTS